jgi:adenine phosphoribosyltransferase
MATSLPSRMEQALRPIPDHPKPGIVFQDITPILSDALLFRQCAEGMAEPFRSSGVTHVLGIEARGFILGAPVAILLGVGFLPARKPGKLPWRTVRESYALEYGTDALEAHHDACKPGSRILIVDDVLATGGTAEAAGKLVRQLGGDLVGWSFLLELGFLGGRAKLAGAPSYSLVIK